MCGYRTMRVRSLSFHARYRCAHSGACCTSSWPIPVEADRLERLRAAVVNGRLRTAAGRDAFTAPDDAPAETPALLSVVNGQCAFYDAAAHRCHAHTALGHDALPLACRQFPRVVLHDPRGVSLVLSHYCPTAARLLDTHARVEIVENPDAFPPGGEYVGLDARTSLPPLLRPDMLMDWDSWWEFERLAVDFIGNATEPMTRVLIDLRAIIESIRTWSPDAGDPLIERVRSAFAAQGRRESFPLPHEKTPGVVRHFLAAHAFANWTSHLGQGLRTWLRSIEAAHDLIVSGRDVRQADLELRHLSDPHEMAAAWSAVEQEPAR
jgi:Fe-S-cluster containining protein